jgi:protein TonB
MTHGPAQSRQAACLLAAIALHGLVLTWMPMLPERAFESTAPGPEPVLSARLLDAPTSAPSLRALTPQAPTAPPALPAPPTPPGSDTAARPHAAATRQFRPTPTPEPRTAAAIPLPASSPAQPSVATPSAAGPSAEPAALSASDTRSANSSSTYAGSAAAAPVAAVHAGASPAETSARPDYAYNPKPDYPAVARQFGLTGRVLMRVLVEPDGMPREIVIANSSGHDMLDQAALKSVRAWRFLPARRAGEAYASWVEFPVRFDLAN